MFMCPTIVIVGHKNCPIFPPLLPAIRCPFRQLFRFPAWPSGLSSAASPVSAGRDARHSASNSRMRDASIRPAACMPAAEA